MNRRESFLATFAALLVRVVPEKEPVRIENLTFRGSIYIEPPKDGRRIIIKNTRFLGPA